MYECSHTCTYMCMHTHGSLYNLLHFSLIWSCHQNQTQYFSSFPIRILLLFSVSSIFPIFPSILAWLHLIVHFRIDQRKSFQFFLTCHPIIYGFPKQTNIRKKKKHGFILLLNFLPCLYYGDVISKGWILTNLHLLRRSCCPFLSLSHTHHD